MFLHTIATNTPTIGRAAKICSQNGRAKDVIYKLFDNDNMETIARPDL